MLRMLTQHHGDIVVNILDLPVFSSFSETVAGSEDVSVRDERSPTPNCPVCLGGSQEEQSSPGELTHLRLLATDRSELRVNISFLALIFT